MNASKRIRIRSAPVIALSCAAFFLLMASLHIAYPGLNYDEMLFTNTALGDVDGSFVYQRIWGVPLFAMPYLSSLKGWLYWIIFKAVDVSVWSIRFPMILTGSAAIAGYYYWAKKSFGDRAAWMGASLLAANASMVWATRQDYSGIEFPLQVLFLGVFFSGAPAWAAAVLLLGLFAKISFLWWSMGVVVAAALAYPSLRRRAAICVLTAAAYLFFWLWNTGFAPSRGVASDYLPRWQVVHLHVAALADGSAFYHHLFGWDPASLLLGKITVLVAMVGAIFLFYRAKSRAGLLFLAGAIACSAAAIFLSTRASGYWHFLPLLPFFALLVGLIASKLGRGGYLLWAAYLVLLLHGQWLMVAAASREPVNKGWTTAIYPLIDWCKAEQRTCVSAQWGTHNQLLAFVKDPGRSFEFSGNPRMEEGLYYVMYSHIPLWDQFRPYAAKGSVITISHQILADGTPIFDLYQVKHKQNEKNAR